MARSAHSLGLGARADPVRSFSRWKKKHSHRQSQKKELSRQRKRPRGSDTKKQEMRKRSNSELEDVGPTSHHGKKAKWEALEPLDTGLSLVAGRTGITAVKLTTSCV
uniref:probable ATP-dependent RNA helicase DDX10 n=1 Tax=Jaculus jaculus TaxID=51337 RepID=UPI001E1B2D10|nr:probable ATP-dependent RNA helicase DDX10 [Jaculus jaculus]